MSSPLRKLLWSIRNRGIARTLHAATKSLGRQFKPQPQRQTHPFDVEHGTDTGGLISGGDLAVGHPSDRFIEGYAAVPPGRFLAILARWQASHPPHSLAEYTFVDLGCGKGRALLLASQLDFREILGVELNPSLAALAQANADRWIAAGKARCPINILRQDAADLSWPASPCVVFLFNPFGAKLLRRITDRLALEFRRRQADLEILYYRPEQANAFGDSFETIWCETIEITPEELAVDPVADPNDQTRAYRLIRTQV